MVAWRLRLEARVHVLETTLTDFDDRIARLRAAVVSATIVVILDRPLLRILLTMRRRCAQVQRQKQALQEELQAERDRLQRLVDERDELSRTLETEREEHAKCIDQLQSIFQRCQRADGPDQDVQSAATTSESSELSSDEHPSSESPQLKPQRRHAGTGPDEPLDAELVIKPVCADDVLLTCARMGWS